MEKVGRATVRRPMPVSRPKLDLDLRNYPCSSANPQKRSCLGFMDSGELCRAGLSIESPSPPEWRNCFFPRLPRAFGLYASGFDQTIAGEGPPCPAKQSPGWESRDPAAR